MASDCKTLFVTFIFNSVKCKTTRTAELSICRWGWFRWHHACLMRVRLGQGFCQSSGVKAVFVTAAFTLFVWSGKPTAITFFACFLLLRNAPTATGNKALRDGELGQKVDGRTDLMLSVLNFQGSNEHIGKILFLLSFRSKIHTVVESGSNLPSCLPHFWV